jgi:nitronate monooxygenase
MTNHKKIETPFTKMMGIDYPIIMAPMFLVSNTKMIIEGLNNGITAAFPALNYRTDEDFRQAIDEIKKATDKPFGINLIVNKSNVKYKAQLETCIEKKVDFIITSLGSPEETINRCKEHGIKVFCDVVDLKYAKKVEALGADALIAVTSEAGGHAGNLKPGELIPMLRKECSIPVIGAGGVARGSDLKKMLDLGADAVSAGTVFIASDECGVSEGYKKAIIEYGGKDVVLTENLSGTPLTVINTPYVQKVGTKANGITKMLLKNKKLKKWVKMFVAVRGMKSIEKAAFSATYKTFWVAGPGIEHIHTIRPVKKIIDDIVEGYYR